MVYASYRSETLRCRSENLSQEQQVSGNKKSTECELSLRGVSPCNITLV